jgi:hypothetical protein
MAALLAEANGVAEDPAHQGSTRNARRIRDDVPRGRRSGDGQRDAHR